MAAANSAASGKAQNLEDFQPNPPHLDGAPDMSSLIHLHEENVVHNLKCRYEKKEIYTYMASVTIAVNPYEELPVYGEKIMHKYRAQRRGVLFQQPPHIYAVAEDSYQSLAKSKLNQSMVICGESGSGKTETAKTFMRYFAHITGGDDDVKEGSIEDRLLSANPILESFGNAQTIMNNNSSRYGKFTKILFENEGGTVAGKAAWRPRIVGAFIETYLLEKSRVVHQDKGERNYHIFYQLVRGLSKSQREEFKLDGVDKFYYLKQSGTDEIFGVDDSVTFKELVKAMNALRFNEEQRTQIFKVLAGMLHLGNVTFDATDADAVAINGSDQSKFHVETAAKLFDIPAEGLTKRLTTSSIKVGLQTIVKSLRADEAVYNRDALVKALYNGLFNLMVRRINKQLLLNQPGAAPIVVPTGTLSAAPAGMQQSNTLWIGILDVFGFECSDFNNSFEQFCINFANERLQQYFNFCIVDEEQREYMREGLPWKPIQLVDNQDTIDLVESKPNGIFAILDSTCVMPKGTDEIFVENLFNANKKHKRITRVMQRVVPKNKLASAAEILNKRPAVREKFVGFTIEHYAGTVCYNSQSFLDKNTDSVQMDNLTLFSSAKNRIAAIVLDPDAVDDDDAAAKKPAAPGAAAAKRAFQSVGSHFQRQLTSLMTTLKVTTPHFVRCVNPNQFKRPQMYDPEYVRPQLRCGGIIEALRILKLGFPSRVTYEQIYSRYGNLIPKTQAEIDDPAYAKLRQKDFCEVIFLAFELSNKDYQFGLTKVFFRPGKQELLERLLGADSKIDPQQLARIKTLMVKKRIHRVKSAVKVLCKFMCWIYKQRAFARVSKACAVAVKVAKAIVAPVRQTYRVRAALTIQTAIRSAAQVRQNKRTVATVRKIQSFLRHEHRRMRLTRHLRAEIARKRALRNAAADRIQRFYWRQRTRRGLTRELTTRVRVTKERKEHQARMENAKREQEERERLAHLEAERKRIEAEEAEARRKAEEERKRREEERLAKERAEQEEKARREAEERERKRKQLEALELARLQKEAAEQRVRQEEEEKRAELKRQEEERLQREKDAKEKELKWQQQIEKMRLQREQEEAAGRMQEVKEEEQRAAMDRQMREAEIAKNIHGAPVLTVGGAAESRSGTMNASMLERAGRERSESLSGVTTEDKNAQAAQIRAQMRQVLLNGGKFLKYGRSGEPHIRHICVNLLGNLHWDKLPLDARKPFPSSTFIALKTVLKVIKGKETEVLKRKIAKQAPDYLCFSIVAQDRTLDLQAVNAMERDLWVIAIESAVAEAKAGMVDFIAGIYENQGPTGTLSPQAGRKLDRATSVRLTATPTGTGAARRSVADVFNNGASGSATDTEVDPAPVAQPQPQPQPGPAPVPFVSSGSATVGSAASRRASMGAMPSSTASPAPSATPVSVSPAPQQPEISGTGTLSRTGTMTRSTSGSISQSGTLRGTGTLNRRASVGDSSIGQDPEDSVMEDTDDTFNIERGNHMLMFGRVGRPQVVFLSCVKDRVIWSKDAQGSNSDPYVALVEVESVRRGKVTEVLQKRSVDALSPPECCFSLILRNGRSLDFQCGTQEKRDRWTNALVLCVKRAKEELLTQTMNKKRQEQALRNATLRDNRSAALPIAQGQPLTRSNSMILPKSVRSRATIIDFGVFGGGAADQAESSEHSYAEAESQDDEVDPNASSGSPPSASNVPVPTGKPGPNAAAVARSRSRNSMISPEYSERVAEQSIAEADEDMEELDGAALAQRTRQAAGRLGNPSPQPRNPSPQPPSDDRSGIGALLQSPRGQPIPPRQGQ